MFAALLLLASASAASCPDPEETVYVAAGRFWTGSDAAERRLALTLSSPAVREARWFDAEPPRHKIPLPAFCIDRFLVTQARYAEFIAATGHRSPGISKEDYLRQGFLVHDYDTEVTRYLWEPDRPPPRLMQHPVVLVSVFDAEAYCRWRRPTWRLPIEAEWEKAARGDHGWVFPWGDTWDPGRANSAASGANGTSAVTGYPGGASPYGMFDAVGNVFQWTASVLENGRRIVKGCAWDDEPGLCRPAFRHGRPAQSRHVLIGFRCAGSPRVNGSRREQHGPTPNNP
ncbi:MAG: SUMF1/EgtB/PvdO family nonheme iron enzyme [Candidatus Rokubacteria bacterium]|nr:SUMF1/EgtB/PvdO family nonheme iron enzyme [Candidatus Rokubacteria bacterium]